MECWSVLDSYYYKMVLDLCVLVLIIGPFTTFWLLAYDIFINSWAGIII